MQRALPDTKAVLPPPTLQVNGHQRQSESSATHFQSHNPYQIEGKPRRLRYNLVYSTTRSCHSRIRPRSRGSTWERFRGQELGHAYCGLSRNQTEVPVCLYLVGGNVSVSLNAFSGDVQQVGNLRMPDHEGWVRSHRSCGHRCQTSLVTHGSKGTASKGLTRSQENHHIDKEEARKHSVRTSIQFQSHRKV